MVRLTAIMLMWLGLCMTLRAQQKPITNDDIVQMFKAGLPQETIVLAIQRGPTKLDTSPNALIALKQQGVPQAVLDAMLKSDHGSTASLTGSSAPFDAKYTTTAGGFTAVFTFRSDGTWSLGDKTGRVAQTGTYTFSDPEITMLQNGVVTGRVNLANNGNVLSMGGSQWIKQGSPLDTPELKAYYVLRSDGIVVTLPSTPGEMKAKHKNGLAIATGGVVQGSKVFLEIPGDRCAVRTGQANEIFLMDQAVSAAMLYHLTPGRDSRQLVYLNVTASLVTARGHADNQVEVDLSPYDDRRIKVTPRTPMAPGEYAFVTTEFDGYKTTYQLSCIGID
jgi:hypothetical protein